MKWFLWPKPHRFSQLKIQRSADLGLIQYKFLVCVLICSPKQGKDPQTNKQAPCCLLITYVALFIPVIEVDFSTISVPCCTEFQEKRPRDLNNSGFSIPALCSALWQCPNCTLGVSAVGFGGSLALLTSWNCTDSITLNSTDGLVFQQVFRRLLHRYQCSVFLLQVSWNLLLPEFD